MLPNACCFILHYHTIGIEAKDAISKRQLDGKQNGKKSKRKDAGGKLAAEGQSKVSKTPDESGAASGKELSSI